MHLYLIRLQNFTEFREEESSPHVTTSVPQASGGNSGSRMGSAHSFPYGRSGLSEDSWLVREHPAEQISGCCVMCHKSGNGLGPG